MSFCQRKHRALFGIGVSVCSTGFPVHAADDPGDIVVTGERIARTRADTASSVFIFTAEDLASLAKSDRLEQLLALLKGTGRTMALAEIALAVGKRPDTTHRLIKGLQDEGQIYRPGHGLYAASQSAQYTQPAFNPQDF